MNISLSTEWDIKRHIHTLLYKMTRIGILMEMLLDMNLLYLFLCVVATIWNILYTIVCKLIYMNTWSPVVGTVWGDYEAFRRWSLDGKMYNTRGGRLWGLKSSFPRLFVIFQFCLHPLPCFPSVMDYDLDMYAKLPLFSSNLFIREFYQSNKEAIVTVWLTQPLLLVFRHVYWPVLEVLTGCTQSCRHSPFVFLFHHCCPQGLASALLSAPSLSFSNKPPMWVLLSFTKH